MTKKDSYSALDKNKHLKTLFFIIFGMVAFGVLFIFLPYLWPFFFALLLYIVLKPVHDFILRYVKYRSISSSIVVLLLTLVVLLPFFSILSSFANQSSRLIRYVQNRVEEGYVEQLTQHEMYRQVVNYLNIDQYEIKASLKSIIDQAKPPGVSKPDNEGGKSRVHSLTDSKGNWKIISYVYQIVAFPLSFLVNFFFMILILFFLFKHGGALSKAFYKTLPFPDDIERTVVDRLKEVVKVLLLGNLLIMTLQGFMVGLGFYIAGLKQAPLLWGSIAAIMSLVPVIGTPIVWLPAVLYLAFTDSIGTAVFLSVWCLGWYLFLENLVKPFVFGGKLKFHPLILFFLLLGSIQVFNLPGVIIGPLLLSLFYSLWEIYKVLDEYKIERGENLSDKQY